jgi:cytosine/adenosine deaminase-related metal-dependent hydrolase
LQAFFKNIGRVLPICIGLIFKEIGSIIHWLGTVGSSRVLGWEDAIGSLEVGKAADLYLIDSRRLDFAGALFDDGSLPVVAGISQNVDMTIVGGKVVVKDGRLVHIDQQQNIQGLIIAVIASVN